MIAESTVRIKDYLTKTKLETLDYVINPYSGCPHKCLYCYATYMMSFSKHKEQWGDFLDIRYTKKKINLYKIKNKKVMISTVTDPYNYFEEKNRITRNIMEQVSNSEAFITVMTKSKLVLRDIDLFKKTKNIEIVISICTADEKLKEKLEPCSSSIAERIEALKVLKENGIKTVVFISPIIPELTDFKQIIELTRAYADEYRFDRLNLRSSFKTKMLNFINKEYPSMVNLFNDIYKNKNMHYFEEISSEIDSYCQTNGIAYKNFIAGEQIAS